MVGERSEESPRSYLTYGPDAANVLFHVVNDRHLRKRPMIFTTNKPLNEWGKVLHDEDMAAAILDRVLERGRFIHLDGPSGRTRHLSLEETLPENTKRLRFSGIGGSDFPEPTAFSPRNARRLIERLSDSGYIKRFPVPGRHVCYPILVNKFIVTDGEHKGEQLNALESIGPNHLKYICGEQECGQAGEHKGQDSASQKRIENREVSIEKKDSHHGLAMMTGREFKKTKEKAKREPAIHPNWERFSELFNHYFHVPPTDGKRKGTRMRCFAAVTVRNGSFWL
jgi:hypothetical protein